MCGVVEETSVERKRIGAKIQGETSGAGKRGRAKETNEKGSERIHKWDK